MASRQSVSSILKPPKVRAPLKEIETVDQDADENTASLPKRKVSFSGKNKIKMYNTGATSLTVLQAPMFDEQNSILSDSSNAEKTKISGKFEKSDGQNTFESTNCTNVENNGRVIIEYESPNDNMEMTEALSGKIFSNTIFTMGNNGSELIDYSSDYSESNMEFTEAKVGQIITDNIEKDFCSSDISETLGEDVQSNIKFSMPLSDICEKNNLNISSCSSNMDFTCENLKPSSANLSYVNTQSSNMELTCMSIKSQKSFLLNDNYKSYCMELTQLPDMQTLENDYEQAFDCSQNSASMDVSCEIKESNIYEFDVLQNNILCTTELEKNKFLGQQIIDGELKYSDNDQHVIEKLSSSIVLMDIDESVENNEYENVSESVNKIELVMSEQNNSNILPITIGNENNKYSIENVQISPEKNITFVENEVLKNTSEVKKKYSRKSKFFNTPLLQGKSCEKEFSDTSIIDEDNQQKTYSRKSFVPISDFNEIQSYDGDLSNKSELVDDNQEMNCSKKYIEEGTSNTSKLFEEKQQNRYSRKSIVPKSDFNETLSYDEDVSNKSELVDDNQEMSCSKKYIEEGTSNTSKLFEEKQQNRYSRKSIVPKSDFNETLSYDEDVSNKSELVEDNQEMSCSKKYIEEGSSNTSKLFEEKQQNRYSRKSIVPKTDFNETLSYDEDLLNKSELVDDNQEMNCSKKSIEEATSNTSKLFENKQQNRYSRKSIVAKSDFNETLSYDEDVSNKSELVEDNQEMSCSKKYIEEGSSNTSKLFEEKQQNNKNRYPRKSIVLKTDFNEIQSFDEDLSNKSELVDDNQEMSYSKKSIEEGTSNTSKLFEDNQYTSSKILDFNKIQSLGNLLNSSEIAEENEQKLNCNTLVVTTSSFDQTLSLEKDTSNTVELTEKKLQMGYSRKSIAPSLVFSETQSLKKKNLCHVAKENHPKKYSRKSIGPSSIYVQDKFAENIMSDNNLVEECNISNSTNMSGISEVSEFMDDVSCIYNNSDIKQKDVSNHYNDNLISKSNQSIVLSVVTNDDLNSPFRKRSKKSMNTKELINNLCIESTTLLLDDHKNKSEISSDDNISNDIECEDKMDISIEPCKDDNEQKVLSKEKSIDISSSLNNTSYNKKVSNFSINDDNNSKNLMNDLVEHKLEEKNEFLTKDGDFDKFLGSSQKSELLDKNNVCGVNELSTWRNEIDINNLVDDNDLLKEIENKCEKANNLSNQITDDEIYLSLLIEDNSTSNNTEEIVDDFCINDLSNMSISDENHLNYEKCFTSNRKRSYHNRDSVPLSCSSFVSKSIHNSSNKDFLKESPIKVTIINEEVNNDTFFMDKSDKIDLREQDIDEENLTNEVLEFLARWNKQSVEQILVLNKCTNDEWIFSMLDNNLILTISYSPMINNHSFLKVDDILFTTKTNTQNEIMKFGINWILTKYNPKMYKQMCFTSRNVELLLKSLQDDVKFINKIMKDMLYVSKLYCVTFKDNKAEFVLHNMDYLLMVRVEVYLCNIHKFSVKDITVDCLFGYFNTNILNEIIEDVKSSSNVLQSLIENLKNAHHAMIK